MTENNLTKVTAYRQLYRAFIVDTQLAKHLGADARSTEIVQHFYPYFIYPIGVVFNISLIIIWQSNKELKSKKSRMTKFYMQAFSLNSVIVLTLYLFNFIHYDNRSIVSYNDISCKLFGYSIRLLTAFHSWFFVLMMYIILSLFYTSSNGNGAIESQAPILIRSSQTTRLNPCIRRFLVVFFTLCVVYSYDLVVLGQLEYKNMSNLSPRTFKRCGIQDSPSQKTLILVSYLIDMITFCFTPFILIVIKTCLAIKKVKEKQNRAAHLSGGTNSNSEHNEQSRLQQSPRSDGFYSRAKRMAISRTVILMVSILPMFICLACYVFYVFVSDGSFNEQVDSMISIDLAFTIFCSINLFSTGVMLFFFGIYADKVFRQVIIDLLCTKMWPCCVKQ